MSNPCVNDTRESEGDLTCKRLRGIAQELLNTLAIKCLGNQASKNYVTFTASVAIVQVMSMIIVDGNEISDEDYSVHEVMKLALCLLEGKNDITGNELTIRHTIWLGNGLKLSKRAQTLLATYYRCDTKVIPERNNNIDAAKLKKRLRKLDASGRFHEAFGTAVFHNVSPGDTLLTSAAYVEMAWREPFSVSLTTKGTFRVSAEERIEVDFMVQKCGLVCVSCEELNANILQLPLTARNLSMLVWLPHITAKGRGTIFPRKLTPEIFRNLCTRLGDTKPKPVRVTLPKFRIEESGILPAILYEKSDKSLENEASFTQGCKVFQTMTIEINECGINTKIPRQIEDEIMAGPAAHDGIQWTNFNATSPFLVTLIDTENKVILMVGRISRPEQISENERRKNGVKHKRNWCCV